MQRHPPAHRPRTHGDIRHLRRHADHVGEIEESRGVGLLLAGKIETTQHRPRIGRVVARLQAREGTWAAQSRNILHAATLHPYAHKIVQKAQQGLAAYWLAVVYPTNAVPALVCLAATARLVATAA